MKQLRTVILLFSANTVSSFAQGITMIAIPWYLLQEPDGNWLVATLAGTVTFASIFWGLYAGTLVDRYNRKGIFLASNVVDASVLIGVAIWGFAQGGLSFPFIALVYTITIFTFNLHYPNVYALIQELFEPAYYSKINSAMEIQHQTTSVLGMMVGGLLLDGTPSWSWWPGAWAFDPWPLHQIIFMDGITYVLAFGLISLIPYRRQKGTRTDKGAVLERLQQGFNYLRTHRPIMIFGIASHMVFFALIVVIQVGMPIYVMDYLEEPAIVLSSFKGIYSIGAVSAGILGLAIFFKRGNLIRQVIGLVGIAGILFTSFALFRSVWVTLLLAYSLGICNAGTRILRITYLVKVVPNHVIGRVNAFFTVVNLLMRVSFISLLTLPFFADHGENIIYGFVLLGICMFVAAAILVLNFPSFDQDAAQPERKTLEEKADLAGS